MADERAIDVQLVFAVGGEVAAEHRGGELSVRLRRVIGESAQQPRYLQTVRGVGIRLAAPDDLAEGGTPGTPA